MMVRNVLIALTCLAATATAYDLPTTRTLLEKQLFYADKDGKIGECKYWALHMGAHDCKLRRKFPGKDTMSVDAAMNFDLISSGYISGNGYSAQGKIDCLTGFHLAAGDSSHGITLDSIQYAYDYCGQAVLTTGEKGALRIDAEGTLLRPKKLLLRIYHMVDYYGAEVLRPKTELTISAFAFSKEAIKQAVAADKKLRGN